jgi:hypothetical protein
MLKNIQSPLNFPRKLSDLDSLGKKLIEMDPTYDSIDYKDPEFRKRRLWIGEMPNGHQMGAQIR